MIDVFRDVREESAIVPQQQNEVSSILSAADSQPYLDQPLLLVSTAHGYFPGS